jgi:glucose-6-phosphate isomerase, archaeal
MKESVIHDLPVTVQIDTTTGEFVPCLEKVARHVSDLAMMFSDQQTVQQIIGTRDKLVYEIRYYPFITSKSDMALGTTAILPGKVGNEYHFHARDDQPEIYYCVQGEGFLQMESRAGDYHAVPWRAGTITHIPPQYAHRVINTGSTTLVFIASFHVSAGHEYGLIEARGFRNIIIEQDGSAVEVPNPRRRDQANRI